MLYLFAQFAFEKKLQVSKKKYIIKKFTQILVRNNNMLEKDIKNLYEYVGTYNALKIVNLTRYD